MGRHENVVRYEKYSEDGTGPEMCPRCKEGILADHEDRETCGKCGYSKITKRRSPGQNQGKEDQSEDTEQEKEDREEETEEPEDENGTEEPEEQKAENEEDEAEDAEDNETDE